MTKFEVTVLEHRSFTTLVEAESPEAAIRAVNDGHSPPRLCLPDQVSVSWEAVDASPADDAYVNQYKYADA